MHYAFKIINFHPNHHDALMEQQERRWSKRCAVLVYEGVLSRRELLTADS